MVAAKPPCGVDGVVGGDVSGFEYVYFRVVILRRWWRSHCDAEFILCEYFQKQLQDGNAVSCTACINKEA